MLYNIARQINWIDIFVVILLFRVVYVAVNQGLPIEIFKILGTISAIYLSLHYYAVFGNFVQRFAGFINISAGTYNLVAFIILSAFGYTLFLLLRNFISHLVSLKAVTSLNKWLGLGLGVIRGFLLASLIIFIFVLSGDKYLKASVKDSYSGKFFFKIAPAAYTFIWNGVASKIMFGEKFNNSISEVKTEFYK